MERISIHAPPRGATQTRFFLRCACKSFQFTPLREGRQCFFQLPTFARLISIHAPPRGATKMEGSKLYIVAISIHAPPRGATRSWRAYRDDANYFNSRPSARGDALLSAGFCKSLYFNSRPSARGDAGDVEYVNYWQIIFQFTPLREGRRCTNWQRIDG